MVLFLRNNYKIGYDFDCLLRRRVLFCETLGVGGWGDGGGVAPHVWGLSARGTGARVSDEATLVSTRACAPNCER